MSCIAGKFLIAKKNFPFQFGSNCGSDLLVQVVDLAVLTARVGEGMLDSCWGGNLQPPLSQVSVHARCNSTSQ